MPFKTISRCALLFLLTLVSGRPAWVEQEQPVELRFHDLYGRAQSVESFQGKIVVVNFWATWCVPCAHEIPMLVRLEKEYAKRGVAVIGISLDDGKTVKRVPKFIRKKKITFPIWVGATADDLARLGLGQALPATLFLDRQGNVAGRVLGELKEKGLRHRVDWMLGDHSGSPPKPLEKHLSAH